MANEISALRKSARLNQSNTSQNRKFVKIKTFDPNFASQPSRQQYNINSVNSRKKKNQRRCSIVGLGKQNFWPIFCNSALPKTQCQFCECQIKAINDGAQLTVVSRCLPRRRPRWSFLFFLPPRISFDWEPLSGEGGEENKMTFPAVWRTLPVLTMGDVDGDRDERWKQFFFLQI